MGAPRAVSNEPLFFQIPCESKKTFVQVIRPCIPAAIQGICTASTKKLTGFETGSLMFTFSMKWRTSIWSPRSWPTYLDRGLVQPLSCVHVYCAWVQSSALSLFLAPGQQASSVSYNSGTVVIAVSPVARPRLCLRSTWVCLPPADATLPQRESIGTVRSRLRRVFGVSAMVRCDKSAESARWSCLGRFMASLSLALTGYPAFSILAGMAEGIFDGAVSCREGIVRLWILSACTAGLVWLGFESSISADAGIGEVSM